MKRTFLSGQNRHSSTDRPAADIRQKTSVRSCVIMYLPQNSPDNEGYSNICVIVPQSTDTQSLARHTP